MNDLKILVADSGSSKTNWILVDKTEKHRLITKGLNPQINSIETLDEVISSLATQKLDIQQVEEIYFYGAGCSTEENCHRIESLLKKHIPNSKVNVSNDLLASAISVFGNKFGLACILGTGSNSGMYKGGSIYKNVPSLGYILGDEGSGSNIGKLFLRDLIYNLAPEDLINSFNDEYKLSIPEIFNLVYRSERPNVFIAQAGGFVSRNNQNPYCEELITVSTKDFFKYHVLPYMGKDFFDLGFTGSIAYANQNIISTISESFGLKVLSFLKNPIDKLVDYHLNLSAK